MVIRGCGIGIEHADFESTSGNRQPGKRSAAVTGGPSLEIGDVAMTWRTLGLFSISLSPEGGVFPGFAVARPVQGLWTIVHGRGTW